MYRLQIPNKLYFISTLLKTMGSCMRQSGMFWFTVCVSMRPFPFCLFVNPILFVNHTITSTVSQDFYIKTSMWLITNRLTQNLQNLQIKIISWEYKINAIKILTYFLVAHKTKFSNQCELYETFGFARHSGKGGVY